jgi:transcriptional regulator with XRE-family HTH domain
MTNEMFRAIRLYKDLTQRDFAKIIGISKATVARIESGSLRVTPRVKAKIASNFELTDDFFMFYEKMRKIS